MHDVVPDDRAFTARIEGVAPPRLSADAFAHRVSSDVGDGTVIDCLLYDKPIGAAGGVFAMMTNLLEKTASARAVRWISAGVFGDRPYLVRSDTTPVVAPNRALTVAVVGFPMATVACLQAGGGDRTAFLRIVGGFVRSLVFAAKAPVITHRNLSISRFDGGPMGFGDSDVRPLATSGSLEITRRSGFSPRTSTEADAIDLIDEVEVDPAGEIVRSRYSRSINGESKVQLKVERVQPRRYVVEGTIDDRAVKYELTPPVPMLGQRATFRARADHLRAGSTSPLVLGGFCMGETAPQTSVHERLDDTKDGKPVYRVSCGGADAVRVVVDRDGSELRVFGDDKRIESERVLTSP